MRYVKGETWPSCDRCERQLPTFDEGRLVRLGWRVFTDAEGRVTHVCGVCASVDSKADGVLDAPSGGLKP